MIVLGSAEGLTKVEVGARCGVEPQTVAWRRRFLEHRLDGLVDDPSTKRPGSYTYRDPRTTA
jgi:hypothetical protein